MLTEEQKKFVEDNICLLYHYLHKHKLDIEEWFGILACKMCECVISFDNSRKIKFSTYLYFCFDNEVRFRYRQSEEQKLKKYEFTKISTDYIIKEDFTKSLSLMECIPDNNVDIEETNINKDTIIICLRYIRNNFSKRDVEIFRLYLEGKKQRTIAEIIGCSQPQVGRIIKNIQKSCRNYINK